MGHEETYSTIQVDFHLPNQFELNYTAADGKLHRPVMIHRAIISTMERMVAYLIEHYAGAFPLWLAPVQVGSCRSASVTSHMRKKFSQSYKLPACAWSSTAATRR